MAFEAGLKFLKSPGELGISAGSGVTFTVLFVAEAPIPAPAPTPTPFVVIKEVIEVKEVPVEVIVVKEVVVEVIKEVILVATPTPAPVPINKTVKVSSKEAWTDTGVVVSQGDILSITASGNIIFDSAGRNSGPDGSTDFPGGCSMFVTHGGAPTHSLVGNVASSVSLDGKGFFVGSNYRGGIPVNNTTDQSGTLFLGFNDGFVSCDRSGLDVGGVGDNSGSFTVTIVR